MKNAIVIAQIVLAVLLTAAILLQQKGSGLSATFGGDGNVFRTMRGIEKTLFYATIVLAALFLGSGVASLLI
jgi:protein translocase SecG subunit